MRLAPARIGLALAIGIASGIAGFLVGMPLPWMLGPMIGVTAAALARLPIAGPDRLRPLVIPVIGVMIGSAVTPDIVGQAGDWLMILAILPLLLAATAGASYAVYRRVGGYDPVTAFYSSMPGGLTEMMVMGGAMGGDERRIALAHAARVLLVILFVALFFGLALGVRSGGSGDTGWVPFTALTVRDYLILAACAVIGYPLGFRLRLPAAPVFGPMILSGAAHLAGWVTVAPPSVLVIAAQVVMGTVIGARFIGTPVRDVARELRVAALATPLMLGVAVVFAVAVSGVSDMPLSQTFLGYAPGGLTEMSLLTLAIGQDVAFVSVTHIVRITLVIAVAPVVFGALRGYIKA